MTVKSQAPTSGAGMGHHHARSDRISLVFGCVMSVLLAIILARVAQLQVSPPQRLLEQHQARVTTRVELPVRGDLMDRRGRLLAATRFGWRVHIDPVNLRPVDVDVAIVEIARAIGRPTDEVGERVMWALAENDRRREVVAGVHGSGPTRPTPVQWLRGFIGLPDAGDQEVLPVGMDRLHVEPELGIDDESGELVSPISFADVPTPPEVLRPIRYLPFREVVDDAAAAGLRRLRIRGIGLERAGVREPIGGPAVAAVVGKVGVDESIGMEARLNDRLAGRPGHVSYYRDARGRPLWIEPGQVRMPVHGEDVRLSIDLEIQSIGLEELARGVEESDAAGGRLVAIDPRSGEILAMCDIVRDVPGLKEYPWEDDPRALGRSSAGSTRPFMAPRPGSARYRTIAADTSRERSPGLAALFRNRCAEDVYEPGSTFKAFVWCTITELGLARVEEVFDTESGRWVTPYGRRIADVTKRATMTWADVLVNSSNIGMSKAVERLTHRQLHDAVRRFGFGSPTGVGIGGEASGIVTRAEAWTIYSQTSYAMGHEVAVTPLQMVRAFSAFARTGPLAGTLSELRLTAVSSSDPPVTVLRRVTTPACADLTRRTLLGVAENMQNRLRQQDRSQSGWRYTIYGKSGTAEIPLGKAPPGKRRPAGSTGYFDDQYNSSFIAAGPFEDPRLVVIAVIDDPGPSLVFARPLPRHYGAATAGPVVRRFMERALTYLGAPPSSTDDPDAHSRHMAAVESQ